MVSGKLTMDQSGGDAELLAITADQQATGIVLRALLKAHSAFGPLRRGELVARVRSELERFAGSTEDPAWQGAVAALVEALLEDLSADNA